MAKQDDLKMLRAVAKEIGQVSEELLERRELNRYNERTARADCLRLLRAAIELAPTNG